MKAENSQQHFYLPPAVDAPSPAAFAAHASPAAPLIRPRASRSERALQQITYILVSLAALVYICQTLFTAIGSLPSYRISVSQAVSAPPPPPTHSEPPAAAKPETVYRALPPTQRP